MIPTTKEIFDQNLTQLETAMGQKSPVDNKSFLRVLAAVLTLRDVSLYKFGTERALQNLAMTGTGGDLALIGAEKTVVKKPAVATQITATLNSINDVIIPITATFVSPANGLTYNIDSAATAIVGVVTLNATCAVTGVTGNLQVGDLLNIVSPVAGADSTATVTATLITGANEESENAFRSRVLFAQQSTTGGGNATDHKIWAESVAGVSQAYPYAGKPADTGTSYPGDRTVYIEADTSIQVDGIPLTGMLNEVRAAINFDPLTGKSRNILGVVNSTLYILPIIRTAFDVVITDLVTPSGQEASVKASILTAIITYFLSVKPYIEGVDLEQNRNDTITTPAVSEVVQSVIRERNSSASNVTFTVGGVSYDTYTLSPGELAKSGTLGYV